MWVRALYVYGLIVIVCGLIHSSFIDRVCVFGVSLTNLAAAPRTRDSFDNALTHYLTHSRSERSEAQDN